MTTTTATARETASMTTMITTAAVLAAAVVGVSTMAAPTNCQPLPSGALVNCCHPPLPLPPLVCYCIVVHHPLSLSLVACCHAIVDSRVKGRFYCQSSTSPLGWSHHQPPPAFTSSDDGWLLCRCLPPAIVRCCSSIHKSVGPTLTVTWAGRAGSGRYFLPPNKFSVRCVLCYIASVCHFL